MCLIYVLFFGALIFEAFVGKKIGALMFEAFVGKKIGALIFEAFVGQLNNTFTVYSVLAISNCKGIRLIQ